MKRSLIAQHNIYLVRRRIRKVNRDNLFEWKSTRAGFEPKTFNSVNIITRNSFIHKPEVVCSNPAGLFSINTNHLDRFLNPASSKVDFM